MFVVCVDPGIVSIGIVHVEVTDAYKLKAVLLADAVDITKQHAENRHIHTYLQHFFTHYSSTFEEASWIIVEKQPIKSAGMPFELIVRERYGSKCVFICPQTLHKRFELAGYEYDARKRRSVQIVLAELQHWVADNISGASAASARICSIDRKHDICDAFLLLFAWLEKQHKVQCFSETPFHVFVEKFRYDGKKK